MIFHREKEIVEPPPSPTWAPEQFSLGKSWFLGMVSKALHYLVLYIFSLTSDQSPQGPLYAEMPSARMHHPFSILIPPSRPSSPFSLFPWNALLLSLLEGLFPFCQGTLKGAALCSPSADLLRPRGTLHPCLPMACHWLLFFCTFHPLSCLGSSF